MKKTSLSHQISIALISISALLLFGTSAIAQTKNTTALKPNASAKVVKHTAISPATPRTQQSINKTTGEASPLVVRTKADNVKAEAKENTGATKATGVEKKSTLPYYKPAKAQSTVAVKKPENNADYNMNRRLPKKYDDSKTNIKSKN